MIDRIVLDKVNMKAPMQVESSMLWNTRVEFRKGEAYLIEAASGRGKSSLCSFLCGLRSDYTGKISFLNDGTELNLSSAADYVLLRQRAIAIMFQDLKLFPELSSLDNVMLKNQITGFCTEKEVCDMLGNLDLRSTNTLLVQGCHWVNSNVLHS